jgi:transposase
MCFLAVKSEAQQAAAMTYRTRDLLVRQRTRTVNALPRLAEHGIVASTGSAHVGRLAILVDWATARCTKRCATSCECC